MKITRREILKAIRTEKLVGGEGVIEARYDLIHSREIVDEKCRVCAVGAVLRQKGIDSYSMSHRFNEVVGYGVNSSDTGDLDQAFKNKNYMCALSIKFEQLAKSKGVGPKTKEKLCGWVKANFPKVIDC